MMISAWLAKRKARKAAAAGLYQSIVTQSRNPAFFTGMDVADTMDGRFDLLSLHEALVILRLRALGREGERLAQDLFDRMFIAVDEALREMGIGDLGVPKHMQKMMKAFNGRIHAYETAMAAGTDDAAFEAVARNVYRCGDATATPPGAYDLAAYAVAAYKMLSSQTIEQLMAGEAVFPVINSFVQEERRRVQTV